MTEGYVYKEGFPNVGVESFLGATDAILLGDDKGNLYATATIIGKSKPNDIQIGDLD